MPINHLAPVSIRRTTPYRHQSSRVTFQFQIYTSSSILWIISQIFFFLSILFRYSFNDILLSISLCEQNSSWKLFHAIFFDSFLILSRCPNDPSFDNIPSQRFNFSKLSHYSLFSSPILSIRNDIFPDISFQRSTKNPRPMNLISRVKSFIIHYRTRCSCVSRLRTREMFMHSSNTSSPTYELSFPLGGDLLKLFMFDTRFFTRDASLSLYVYIYISSDRMKTIEFLYTNLHHSFILSRFSYHTSTFSPSSCRRFFTGERDEVLFVDLMARARFGRNVFTGV